MMSDIRIIIGDCREKLKEISALDELKLEMNKFSASKGEIEFTINNQPFGEETKIVDEAKKLSIEDTSDVFETTKGYYVIKRVQSKNQDTYEKAIEEAIQKEKEALLNKAYLELKEGCNIKINKNLWDKIKIGETIITE